MNSRVASYSAWVTLLQARYPGVDSEFLESSVELVASAIADTLARGGEISLPGVGVFHVEHCPSRLGFNPQSGVKILIPPKNRVKFTVSELLSQKLPSICEDAGQ